MAGEGLRCPRCNRPIPPGLLDRPEIVRCGACKGKLLTRTFAALWAPPAAPAQAPSVLLEDAQATCFFHPTKQAAQSCEHCGRLLCSLCAVQVSQRTVCPSCLQQPQQHQEIEELHEKRVAYDRLALTMACWPLLVTAIIALVLVARYRGRPGSLVAGTSRVRWVLATVVALLQLTGWVLLVAHIVYGNQGGM